MTTLRRPNKRYKNCKHEEPLTKSVFKTNQRTNAKGNPSLKLKVEETDIAIIWISVLARNSYPFTQPLREKH
jgi:hypothetical protein